MGNENTVANVTVLFCMGVTVLGGVWLMLNLPEKGQILFGGLTLAALATTVLPRLAGSR